MGRIDLVNARVLLTGASSGIGKELAIQLARKGAQILITARREERLRNLVEAIGQQTECPNVVYLAGDITQDSHRRALVDLAKQAFDGIDVVINNAGIGAVGRFDSADSEHLNKIMDVNFFAAVELIRLALPIVKLSGSAAIVNIGSVLAQYAVPKKSEYCASKSALKAFSDSIRLELRKCGVSVISVHPNTTSSEFFDSLIERHELATKNPLSSTPAWVAQKIIHAIERRRNDVVLTASGHMMVGLSRLFPRIMRVVLGKFG